MTTVEELPSFRYYPSAYEDGALERSQETCAGCGQSRGWLYLGVIYSTDIPDEDHFCPWCIQAGTVAQRGGAFNDLGGSVPNAVEVTSCTPGFASWQDQHWPVHHDKACVFQGVVGKAELQMLGDAARTAMTDEVRSWGWDEEAVSQFVDSLTREGQPTGYVWRCEECGGYLCRADFP